MCIEKYVEDFGQAFYNAMQNFINFILSSLILYKYKLIQNSDC